MMARLLLRRNRTAMGRQRVDGFGVFGRPEAWWPILEDAAGVVLCLRDCRHSLSVPAIGWHIHSL